MVSTPSAILGLEKMGQSDEVGSWWDNLNQVIDMIDQAIAGMVNLSTTGGDTALSATNYSADQARMAIIRIAPAQTLVSNVRVTTTRARLYYITNESSAGAFTVSFGGNLSNLVVIPRGSAALIFVRSDSFTKMVTPLMVLANNLIDVTSIGNIDTAQLAAGLASTISTASSNAAAAVSTANAASATAAAANAVLPAGSVTSIIFFQASVPAGWTLNSSHANKTICIANTGGSSGGSIDFLTLFARTAVDNYTLQVADMPAHTHGGVTGGQSANHVHPQDHANVTVNYQAGGTGVTVKAQTGGGDNTDVNNVDHTHSISSQGGGGAHTHNIDMRLKHIFCIIGTRN